jgi:hypothetical protein
MESHDMRKQIKGSFTRVYLSAREVQEFKRHWPGSALRNSSGAWFEFASNGDLVDIGPYRFDGPDALALSQDAQEFARTGMLPVAWLEPYQIIIRCINMRGDNQAAALDELKRRGLWLSDDQKRQAGLVPS